MENENKKSSKAHLIELDDDEVSLLYEMLLNASIGGSLLDLAYKTKKTLEKYYKVPEKPFAAKPQPR